MREIGEQFKTRTSPNYSIGSTDFMVSIGAALLLIVANIIGMLYIADTQLADVMVWLYTDAPFAPFIGLLIFGIALTAGRYFGLKSIANDNLIFAGLMVLVVEVTYAIFGGGVLSLYSASIWLEAVYITFGLVALYTFIVTGVVYSTDHSFEKWGTDAAVFMIIGVLAVFLFTLVNWAVLMWIGFIVITIGFMIDLVYEIWHTSAKNRSALANGFAVYIAFMGVFVHILQLVLEILADG